MIKINWKKDYKQGEFICPEQNCNSKKIKMLGSNRNKKMFQCLECEKIILESSSLNPNVVSRFKLKLTVKDFNFNDDQWDLRSINPNFNIRDSSFTIHFENIEIKWFKNYVKQYVLYLCKIEKPFNTINQEVVNLRFLSRYLIENNILSAEKINRSLILDFLLKDKTGVYGKRVRLGTLKRFFETAHLKKWFSVEQDIIRNEDFPKKLKHNPDPISDLVREQIENNLHQLPEAIARMWIIAFFTAMRPNELGLLKKNCLVQEGDKWKVVWERNKSNVNDYHEVPITRSIAKVIQEQKEYIENLWGKNWEYLFCHYQGISRVADLSHPRLKPVRKVMHPRHCPFRKIMRCFIEALDIRDENGNLAKFTAKLVRPTRLTQLFEQGHDLAVVSAWAGHRQLAVTSTYYTKVSCELIEKEASHIQKALLNTEGKTLHYESFPKSFWKTPQAHKLELSGDHINTPIYGYCGLPLDQHCDKFRACYTCANFVATPDKLPQYIKTRDELRGKQSQALAAGQDVLVEQFGTQADQLDKIIASLQEAA